MYKYMVFPCLNLFLQQMVLILFFILFTCVYVGVLPGSRQRPEEDTEHFDASVTVVSQAVDTRNQTWVF